MTATNHALTGAAIAVIVRQPVLASVLALASHFVCDAIPHWDYVAKFPLKKYIALTDIIIAALLVLLISVEVHLVPDWLIFLCAGLAVAPDAMWLPHILKGRPIPFDGDQPLYVARRFHRWIQWSESRKGIFVEVIWLALMSTLIKVLAN